MTHLDLGGGTGAAAWAANAVWPEARSEIVERLPAALALGKQLGTAGPSARGGQDVDAGTVGSAWRWTLADLRTWTPLGRPVDLVTIGYVLNELGSPARADLLRKATAVATTVVVVEPGTPAGHRRTLEARDFLIDQEFRIAAPCPHQGSCPVDWCHFATRLPRTELHRTLKDGSRNYEDEKFSYVVATRAPVRPAAARVLTRPVKRKGQVLLDLCTATGSAERVVVPKSSPAYRPTRNTTWGDTWNGRTR
jgi:ribosomal protein RSM22 (predicted rRNA methylase)